MSDSVVEFKSKQLTKGQLLSKMLVGDLPKHLVTPELRALLPVASVVRSNYQRLMISAEPREITEAYLGRQLSEGSTVWALILGSEPHLATTYPRIELEVLEGKGSIEEFMNAHRGEPSYHLKTQSQPYGAIGYHSLREMLSIFCRAAESNCDGYLCQYGVNMVRLRHMALIDDDACVVVSFIFPSDYYSLSKARV